MSTALGVVSVYPQIVRDDYTATTKITSSSSTTTTTTMSSSHHHHVRRPSTTTSITGGGSYTSSSSHYHHNYQPTTVLSTLEDSGNLNNRGAMYNSTSQLLHHPYAPQLQSQQQQQPYDRDNSTCVNTGVSGCIGTTTEPRTNGHTLHRAASTGSITTSNHNQSESYDGNNSDSGGDRVVEEKRKRSNGNGYSIHKYTLGRLLGKGGFAKVYLCTAMDTGKNYAAKVVPKANLVKARAQQKLQAEIKIHRNLKHRHVCQFKHYFEDRNNCYILLELCHNQSLNEMIKRRKRITEPEAAYFMRQLLEATRYMHDENVIHRDLKLGNLFIDKDMCIKVGDLGLATKVEDKDEKRKTICGTPNYIAPEIIQGDKSKRGHSFEVDVWSMGVILYTILIGKPPYEAKDVKATYQRILNNEYSFPRHVDISPSAKSLIKSMLQSLPSDRPTLDEIDAHPFLAESHVPTFLPSSVLSLAPTWRVDEYGELVCTEKNSDVTSLKKPSLPRSSSFATGRRPFASHDPNLHKAASSTTTSSSSIPRKNDINMERVVKTAVAAMSKHDTQPSSYDNVKQQQQQGTTRNTKTTSSTVTPAFEIFDESQSIRKSSPKISIQNEITSRDELESVIRTRNPSNRQTPPPIALTEEVLCQQTQSLSINGPRSSVARPNSAAASSVLTHATESIFSTTEHDAEIFQLIVDHLDTVLNVIESRKGLYRTAQLRPLSSRRGPTKWVTRYVDYTCKYGLGFLLNDGCSGVYFNDSTKTALEPRGNTFQYIERKRSDDMNHPKRRGETVIQTLSLENYPESLKKKVTLLKHFRNYLLQQQLYDGIEDVPITDDTRETVSSVLSSDLIYVKKWVRTKHAILFSLSNRTIQVIFYDQTEILLTPDIAFLTYVDKHRQRYTYNFTDELVSASTEIEKRLRYTKDIMLQLLSSGQKH